MPLLDSRIIERQSAARRAGASANGDDAYAEVLRRAQFLAPADQMLVELAVRNRTSRRQLARILKKPAGSVTRRLNRLLGRLHDPLVVALLREDCPLAAEVRQLAVEHFVQGRPMRELADLHRVPVCEVRRMLAYIRGWYRGATGRA